MWGLSASCWSCRGQAPPASRYCVWVGARSPRHLSNRQPQGWRCLIQFVSLSNTVYKPCCDPKRTVLTNSSLQETRCFYFSSTIKSSLHANSPVSTSQPACSVSLQYCLLILMILMFACAIKIYNNNWFNSISLFDSCTLYNTCKCLTNHNATRN